VSGSDASGSNASIADFTVTFVTGVSDLVVADQTIPEGGKVTEPQDITRANFAVEGWYTEGAFTHKWDFAVNVVTAPVTLYARWRLDVETHELLPIPKDAGTSLTFTMGSPTGEPNRGTDENQHAVTFTKGFYMGKYPVTQELYQTVMLTNPSSFSGSPANGETQARRPVENVSWYDALVFCNTLSMLEGLTPVYRISGSTDPKNWGAVPTSYNTTWNGVVMDRSANGYRLPTEAEWEYACRAETTTAYNTGGTISDNTGWYSSNSGDRTHAVGEKLANAWGLYDMHGNVLEWCWDWHAANYGGLEDVTDPAGAVSGSARVFRGGSFYYDGQYLRSGYRNTSSPWVRDDTVGFRVVRNAP
jgi:uncharacterized repeat protein (TIGR02543 family)